MSRPLDQSHLRYPLTRLLGSSGNVRVLRALVVFGAPLSAVQIARDAGLTPQGARLVLDGLSAQGLVTVLGMSRSQVFTLNQHHPFASLIKDMFTTEQCRWEAIDQGLRQALQAQRAVRSAWLYGSVARGEDTPGSDIDVAFVTEGESSDAVSAVREALHSLEEQFQVHISSVALTPEDVAQLVPSVGWWAEVSRQAKVLKGTTPLLEAARCKGEDLPA